ncbi:MAG: substrate-binding domain-containing protein [Verrucomicrobiota bacterium]
MSIGKKVKDADGVLRAWLDASPVAVGGRLPSERAMARELDLQHYAVNRAVANLISEGRVERKGYKLFVRRDKELANPGRSSCDLVISQDSGRLDIYEKIARDLDIDLRIHAWQVVDASTSQLSTLKAPEVESVIFATPLGEDVSVWQVEISRLVHAGIPVVCVDRRANGASSVVSDVSGGIGLIFERLFDLGHREMAFLTMPPWIPVSGEMKKEWEQLCKKFQLESSGERLVYSNGYRLLKEDSIDLARRLANQWKEVTALVVLNINDLPIQQLLDALHHQGIEVPSRLTVASTGDFQRLHFSVPAVGAPAFDINLFHETAFYLIQRALRRKREFGVLPPPAEVCLLPNLVERDSFAVNPFASVDPAVERPNLRAELANPPLLFANGDKNITTARYRAYDSTRNQPDSRFNMIDLADHVNRPLKFRRGWLGDLPLTQLEPGRQMFHGVPFQILGGNHRSDCGVVVLKSLSNKRGNGQPLRSSVHIDIQSKVAAIYILHGCGYGKYLKQFATYTFFAGKRRVAEVPMVALGRPQNGNDAVEIAQANIQDWWPDFPPCDFPHARMAPLTDETHPGATGRHVSLYTLEWINPTPDKKITHIEITSDPDQSTTLGVLGITTLLPGM